MIMLITSTSTINNEKLEYLWFISSEVIVGANIVKDFFAGLTDIFGWRSSSYEKSLIEGKNNAIDELTQKAKALWASAVVWVKMDYEAVGKWWSMFMINASGTAVKH
jgi:uncharacterized protein YbjQ (UPF0145 family)